MEIEPSHFNSLKEEVEREIEKFVAEGNDKTDYLGNFRCYLWDIPPSLSNYRYMSQQEGGDWNKKLRDYLIERRSGAEDYSERRLNKTGEEFFQDIDETMAATRISKDRVLLLSIEAGQVNREAAEKAFEELFDYILPAFIYLRAMGYSNVDLTR